MNPSASASKSTSSKSSVMDVPSADQIDRCEQPDPDDVDEVPVVRHNDRRRRLSRGALAQRGPNQEEQECDQTADDVQSVEAGGEKEHRPETGRLDGVAVR